jgi:hypothetical protein
MHMHAPQKVLQTIYAPETLGKTWHKIRNPLMQLVKVAPNFQAL